MEFLSTDYLLIHGYASKISVRGKFKKGSAEDIFAIFRDELGDNRAHFFEWGIEHDVQKDPRDFYNLYSTELQTTLTLELIARLKAVIKAKQPKHIICHSMGAQLMINVLNSTGYSLPNTVKSIVCIQADIAYNQPLTNVRTQLQLHKGELVVKNTYCPWDHALITSSLIHRQKRAGLTGWDYPGVENIFHPLKKLVNVHQNVLSDKSLKEKVIL